MTPRPANAWPLLAAATIVVTLALQLGLAAWNRGGEPATLELTEGSLELPWSADNDQGTPLSLHLDVAASELTIEELATLGFPVVAMEREGEPGSGFVPLPRNAWMVVDTTPSGWRRHLEREQEEIGRLERSPEVGEESLAAHRSALAALRRGPQRAVISAVGLDPAALRRDHPDRRRQAVVSGTVHARRHWAGRRWQGTTRPAVTTLAVPPQLHRLVRQLVSEAARRRQRSDDATASEPPFRAVVAWGRRGEPWLRTVEVRPERPPTHGAQETRGPLVRSVAPAPLPDLGAGEPP